jgi:hypothetical protein
MCLFRFVTFKNEDILKNTTIIFADENKQN